MARKQKAGCRWKRWCWSSLATVLLLLVVRGTFSGEVFPADGSRGMDTVMQGADAQETSGVVKEVLQKVQQTPLEPKSTAQRIRSWQLHELPIVPGCEGCCSQDVSNVPCLDVEKCAEAGPINGKYALVLSHWGRPSEGMLGSIKSMRAAADKLGQTDLLMVMLKSDANQTTPKIANLFRKWGIKLHSVDWDVPPNMKHYPKTDWCGHQDLIRLNVLGIEGYDAVAYFDGDCEFQGDITPMMRCAASGKFLSTSGGMGEALNVGFFATKPDRRLVDAAVLFAQQNSFDHNTGWGGAGWAPNGGYYVGGECGQGFFYTLFYRNSPGSKQALESVGLWDTFEAAQLDRCIWNYQTDSSCRADLDCRHVRVHHKPTRERGSEKECDKLQFRHRRESLQHRQTVSRPPPTEEELRWAREGQLLKHSAGLCLRSSEEDGDGTLMLLSCSFPPVEQNIRIVDANQDRVYLKQGGQCAHVEGDDDPEMTPKEPKLAFPVDCVSKMYQPHFKKIPSTAVKGGFLLQHESGRCIHPFEGAVNPRPITDVILHSDCNRDRMALTWLEDS